MRWCWLVVVMAGCRVEWGPPTRGEGAVREDAPNGPVWVYTSMYQHVIDRMDMLLEERFPGVQVEWYQAGSEKVAQRVEAEWAAGGTRACLLLTSDPLWYADLADRGLLRPHFAPNVLQLDRGWVDPDARYAAARLSLMVLAVNPTAGPPVDPPASWTDLADVRFKDRFSSPDPLGSGTMLTTLVFLAEDLGWEALGRVRANGWVASGGSSAVVGRLESGERPVGALLLENVLAAQRKGSPVKAIFPADGAVLVPGPVALTAGCDNPRAAGAVYDWLLSPDGQEEIRAGDMYPVLPGISPPTGAPPLGTIAVRPWSPERVRRHQASRSAVKETWTNLAGGP